MFDFLGASQNVLFSAAIVLMLLIGVVQAIGLVPDAGLDVDADGDLLGWLGVGRLPLLMLLVVYLALFGILGLIGQQASLDGTGALQPVWIAAPVAAVVALPLTGLAARALSGLVPHDHTTAIDVDELVGRFATIQTGRAAPGSPARARVVDRHGQAHHVMVEPDNAGQSFAEGESVILVRREGDGFRAIARGDHLLPTLDP